MSPEREVRTVGRCTDCGDLIREVADVRVTGPGVHVEATVFRRCGCGDYGPIGNPQNANLAKRKTDG